MPKLVPRKPEEVQKVLESLGFKLIRRSGAHAVYRHPDGRWTTVPMHHGKDVARGTLRRIIKDAGISVDEFNELLRSA